MRRSGADTTQVYNQNASKWIRSVPLSLSDFTARPYLFEACGDVSGMSVLDIGCGEGYCARILKGKGASDYVGIDISEKMISAARAQEISEPLGIKYLVGDVANENFNQPFDLCIAVFLFNYLDKADSQQVMEKVFAALNKGGRFVFCVPHPFFPFFNRDLVEPFFFDANGHSYFESVDTKFDGKIWKIDGEALHVQCSHKLFSDYFSMLRNAGFKLMPTVQELTVTEEIANNKPDFFSALIGTPLHVLFIVEK